MLASVVLPAGVAVWAVSGPLQSGWARRSGTPIALLGAAAQDLAAPPARRARLRPPAAWAVPFTARFQGTRQQGNPDGNGEVTVTIAGTFTGAGNGHLDIVLTGRPADDGGGVELTGSQVSLGPNAEPAAYQGQVTQLHGTTLAARVSDAAGATLTAAVALQFDAAGIGGYRHGPGGNVTASTHPGSALRWGAPDPRRLPRVLPAGSDPGCRRPPGAVGSKAGRRRRPDRRGGSGRPAGPRRSGLSNRRQVADRGRRRSGRGGGERRRG